MLQKPSQSRGKWIARPAASKRELKTRSLQPGVSVVRQGKRFLVALVAAYTWLPRDKISSDAQASLNLISHGAPVAPHTMATDADE